MTEAPPPPGTELLVGGATVNQLLVTGAGILFLIWAAKKTYEGILGKKGK